MNFQMQLISRLGHHTKHLSLLKQVYVRPLLQLAVKAIKQDYVDEGALEILSESFEISQAIVDEWYAAILTIVTLHLRSPSITIKPPEFKQCLEELKFSPECIQDIFSVVTGAKRPELMFGLHSRIQFLPHVVACKWRIDITISSSSMSKVMEPCIIMEWILSNNYTYVFELSVPCFYKLKNTVIESLTELKKLESYKVVQNYSS
ncbi:COMM domain-containing protein 5-like [Trichogramma pretiosum]|uniref:COMM domain-containing protein 5-like n=1 Tax=Trichogramma pretiosum TaxID=7493 RepID=UPI0006C9D184|nr:COMM domain-containing protein 5-like [Trichogramma pretiosum]